MYPVVSIVGRPNVGKSTLFNRLVGERKAIVHDESGVTRDRHYGQTFWGGRDFTLIDTGGYVPHDSDVMLQGIREQVHIAIEESDVILFVMDVEIGITDLDKAIADILRRQSTPVLIIANKSDNERRSWQAAEFYGLGFDQVYAISSVNGTGTGDLMDEIVNLLPEESETIESDVPKLAIVGRPNVGKSSLVNALLNKERSIVTDIAGTTRDSINSTLIFNEKEYILVDTAGLRRRTKVQENVEFYSTIRTHKAIQECDVAIIMMDAVLGFEAQDIRILVEAEKFNKGIIIAVNKWDLVEKETNTLKDYEAAIYDKIPDMKYIPIVSVSALTKQRIHKILELADTVIENRSRKISTSHLNDFVENMIRERPLPVVNGSSLKLKYSTQVKTKPPVFAFFMNRPKDLPANYRKFIENKLRGNFDFTGVPITMVFKEK